MARKLFSLVVSERFDSRSSNKTTRARNRIDTYITIFYNPVQDKILRAHLIYALLHIICIQSRDTVEALNTHVKGFILDLSALIHIASCKSIH